MRLPLRIKGEGLGPKCRFSFDTLDIQNVFVNSAHAYEVILENQGAIEAAYSLSPPTSLFGPNFTFAPSSGVVQPGKLQAVQISFRSSELGEFDEEFQWRVEGAPHPLTMRIRGVVIGPTFQLDKTQIKFGTISYGEEKITVHVGNIGLESAVKGRPTDHNNIHIIVEKFGEIAMFLYWRKLNSVICAFTALIINDRFKFGNIIMVDYVHDMHVLYL